MNASGNQNQDAFGQLLNDYYSGEDCCEVIERDDGFLNVTDNMSMYFATFDDWQPHVRASMESVRGRVLDVGAGAGRFALYLQEKGHEVVGIDVSAGALEVCRKRGVRDVRQAPFHRIDGSLGVFDTVLLMGNNFGLFANPRRAKWMLRRLKQLTGHKVPHHRRVCGCLRHGQAGASCLSCAQPEAGSAGGRDPSKGTLS